LGGEGQGEGELINSRQIQFINKRTPSPHSPPLKGGEKNGKIPIMQVEHGFTTEMSEEDKKGGNIVVV
jgi:hypothetical protein